MPALPHAQAAHFLSSALLCNHAGLSVYVGMCSLVKVTVIVIGCFLHCVKKASLAVGVQVMQMHVCHRADKTVLLLKKPCAGEANQADYAALSSAVDAAPAGMLCDLPI